MRFLLIVNGPIDKMIYFYTQCRGAKIAKKIIENAYKFIRVVEPVATDKQTKLEL